MKPLFIFSSLEHSTRLFPDLILSASSRTRLLFPLNFCLYRYLYFCSKFYLLGRVKRPAVMGTVTSFFFPSLQIIELDFITCNKPQQPLFSFHFGPLALFPDLLVLSSLAYCSQARNRQANQISKNLTRVLEPVN